MRNTRELLMFAALTTNDMIINMLKEAIQEWENAEDSQKEDKWEDMEFIATLIISKKMAPDMETALKMGNIIEARKATLDNSEELHEMFNQHTVKKKDIN